MVKSKNKVIYIILLIFVFTMNAAKNIANATSTNIREI